MTTITETITLAVINCGSCGGSYAINHRFQEQCRQEGKSWRCPYCHVYWGFGVGENQRLQNQLDAKKRELEEKERLLRAEKCAKLNEQAAKEKALRKLKRVQKGVCPQCNRTFLNLARHMECQHPTK